jgi:exodeoxyribonuclease V
MEWAPQQNEALEKVRRWLDQDPETRPQIFRLFGFAGTGKTTLAIEIAKMVTGHALFASFTGKAALVMRKKGCYGASTLHSLIYKPRRDWRSEEEKEVHEVPQWEINPESALAFAALLIIDECSMVGEELAADVLSFKRPVLVLGDPAQLPPVSGAGYFTEHEPDVMLTEIHRQAADNPIIRIATMIRTGEQLKVGSHKGPQTGHGVSIIQRSSLQMKTELAADQILCGKNDTRCTINRRMRQVLRERGSLPAGDDLPVVGDRVICLKNKRDRFMMLNGAMWNVAEITDRKPESRKRGRPEISYLRVESADEEGVEQHVWVPKAFWFWNNKASDLRLPDTIQRSKWDEFDYAYAITCHKSQGSQWDKVLVMDESSVFGGRGDDDAGIPARWLYTACTRAAEALIIVK